MLFYIKEEKEYYEKNEEKFNKMKETCKNLGTKFSKYIFYKEMPNKKTNIERNKIFHALEYSLIFLNK